MEPLDFLAAVLPSSGFYCVAELSSKKKEHRYAASLEEILETADKFNAAGKDTYFALAAFEQAGSRMADNARCMRSLFLDIEAADRDYPTKQAAAEALDAFLMASGLSELGKPWLVDSGGGVHVYWPLAEDCAVADWRPLAEGLKRLCYRLGLKVDMTVTADAARVLRMPGTLNHKYTPPKACVVRMRGDVFQFADLQRVIGTAPTEPDETPLNLPGKKPKGATASTVKLMETTTVRFRDILVRTQAGAGCLQLAHYVENASEDGMEPLWRGMLSIAKHCSDGDKAAQRLSAMHPYPESRMQQKLREIKGPYPCTKLDSESPGVCQNCPHWGKITNPLALGRVVQESTEPVSVEVPSASPTAPKVQYSRPDAPKGFVYAAGGGVFRVKEEQTATGEIIKSQFMVLPYDLFVVGVLHKDNTHTAHLVAIRPDGTHSVQLPTKAVVAKDELLKTLAENNIYAAFGQGNDKNLYDYVRACVEEAALKNTPFRIPSQYGWQDDNTFVYAGRVLHPDGSATVSPMPGLENIEKATAQSGTLEGWREVMKLLVAKGMDDIVAHACIGFGSPLMAFTGMRGMTFHAGHAQSGTGKSLALSLCASIWGNPVDYRTGKSTSPVAMQQRAGNLNSLPFVCDELTMKARNDMEWFPGFVFDFSEGRGKERMESGANKERINNTTWSSLAMFTSNVRMLDYMTGVRTHSSEGEIRRFLEWSPSKPLQWDDDEKALLQTIHSNYGSAGAVYAKYLVMNRELAIDTVRQVQTNITKEFNATSDERFWVAGISAVIAGVILAGSKHANIIDLPVKRLVNVFKELVLKSRDALNDSQRNAEDLLNEYTREFYGQFVVVRRVDGNILAELGNGGVVDHSLTRTKVAGRIEHDVEPGYVTYFIEEQLMRRHCAVYGMGFADFKKDLEKRLTVHYLKKDMLTQTKGPQMRVNAIKITRKRGEEPLK